MLVGLAVLISLFYAEEDWRGKRAWENCKRELEAKGAVLDWNAYIPPPVPDDQNFFKAPRMTEWFVRNNGKSNTNDLTERLRNVDTFATNLNEAAAAKYLAWSDQFEPDFDLIREALKRSYARMDGDYSIPYQIPIPNFATTRIIVQTLAQRTKYFLLLGQPENALRELTLLNDSRHFLEGAPTGKPMPLVSAMINAAVTGLYVDTIAYGFQRNTWQESQLVALQKQLAEINLNPFVFDALQEESAATCHTAQISWIPKLFDTTIRATWMTRIVWWFWPSGWTYQNMVNVAVLEQKPSEGFDLAHDTIAPRKFNVDFDRYFKHAFPYEILAAMAVPNFTKAEQTAAHNQTLVNEAQIACALERYRLVHGDYPETLDALKPQFIVQVPHDIINSQPLHYRRTNDGQFVLYSVGWNETDDGGQVAFTKSGSVDRENGDWVWQYPQK